MVSNPYSWQIHRPQVQVPRPDVDLVAETLLGNGSAVVMGDAAWEGIAECRRDFD